MAAIEYGIDGNGHRILAKNAISKRTYKCCYCREDIHVCKGEKNVPYFAHNPISNRTPQQMACEGYKGHGAIENIEDRICIFNGGVPLHLIEAFPRKYELVAMFPPLSSKTMKQVEDVNGKVRVKDGSKEQVFSAWNFRRYQLRTPSSWIDVKPENFTVFNDEIKRKWFLGFRGLDFDVDLFRADATGGVRVGQLANIVVGKEYLFVHRRGNIPEGNGLIFQKKGEFTFPDSMTNTEHDVYSVKVTQITNESIAYIQQKGYQLIEKSDELIPMWPPAVPEGKELIYHNKDRNAYMFHRKESDQQVYCWGDYIPYCISEKNSVLKCSTLNTTLLLSDYSFNVLAKEIRFVLTHDRKNFLRERRFDYRASLLLDDGRKVPVTGDVFQESFKNPIFFESNYKTTILSVRDNYVRRSTTRRIDELTNKNELIFLYKPFGCLKLQPPQEEIKEDTTDFVHGIDCEELAYRLYHCHSTMTMTDARLDKWIIYAKENSTDLAKIFLRWRNQGKMPIKALMILEGLEELIR